MAVHLTCYPLGQESLRGVFWGCCLSSYLLTTFLVSSHFQNCIFLQMIPSSRIDSSSSSHLQEDIDSLVAWSKDNSLFLNPHKCAAVRFFLSGSVCPSYTVDDTAIPTPESHQDLGIMVRGDLSWTDHYSYICSKAYSVLYMIRRSFSTVDVIVKRPVICIYNMFQAQLLFSVVAS